MTTDVRDQLREYFEYVDETLPVIGAVDVVAEAPRMTPPPRRPRAWLVVVAAAVATLLLIGGAALVLRLLEEPEPVIEPTTTTTVEEPTTTTAPPDTPTTEIPTTTTASGAPSVLGGGLYWYRVRDEGAVLGQGDMNAIAYGDAGYVAVGNHCEQEDPDQPTRCAAVLWNSPDGIAWARGSLEGEEVTDPDIYRQQFINSVAHGAHGYIAVGTDYREWLNAGGGTDGDNPGAVWQSVDGKTWTQMAPSTVFEGYGPGQVWMNGVTYGDGGYVAVGSWCCFPGGEVGAIWISPDGSEWTLLPRDSTFSRVTFTDVAFGAGGYVAVGGGDAADGAVFVSPNGVDWTRVPSDENVFGDLRGEGNQIMHGVAFGDGGVVAVGGDFPFGSLPEDVWRIDAAAWFSPDGLSWARVPHDEEAFGPLAEGDGEFELLSVAFAADMYVGVGYDDSIVPDRETAVIATSPDGLSWTRVPHNEGIFGGPNGSAARDVVFLESQVVAVGGDGAVAAVWIGSPETLSLP